MSQTVRVKRRNGGKHSKNKRGLMAFFVLKKLKQVLTLLKL